MINSSLQTDKFYFLYRTHVALTTLSAEGNELTSLDVSKNTALTSLNVRRNRFSADALNTMFRTLHSNDVGQQKVIWISNIEGIDRSIAERKGWQVRVW